MLSPRAGLVLSAVALLGALPPNPNVTLTSRALTVLETDGHIISTATLCPGFEFSQFGPTGPQFSPDQHWILVDVLGPYQPGNVGRNHVLIHVATGRIVTSANFQTYLGVPATLETLAWASGERQTLRYHDGKTAALREPSRDLPEQRCAPAAPAARGVGRLWRSDSHG